MTVLDTAGRMLGSTAIPGDPAAEYPSRPPQVLGVVDGGAVVGITPIAAPMAQPFVQQLGWFRPGRRFVWLCGTPTTRDCPRTTTGSVGDIVAVGRYWVWIAQFDGPQWGMPFIIRDGTVRPRDPTSRPRRYVEAPTPFIGGSVPPFALDTPSLARRQPSGFAVRARYDVDVILSLTGDHQRRSATVTYDPAPLNAVQQYVPGLTFAGAGVAWTSGRRVWFWDHRSGRLWHRDAVIRTPGQLVTMLAIAGRVLLLGTGANDDYAYRLTADLDRWRLPDDASPRRWTRGRRLRPGDDVRLRSP